MRITLEAWAEENFRPAPKIHTLRAWAKTGRIVPPPVKVGRLWMVETTAQFCPAESHSYQATGLSDRASKILKAA